MDNSNFLKVNRISLFKTLLKSINDSLLCHNGFFFGGIVRDYFCSNILPHDIDVAVDDPKRFISTLKSKLGLFLFNYDVQKLEDYGENQKNKSLIISSTLILDSNNFAITFKIDIIQKSCIKKSDGDFDVNCLIYLPTHSFGIFKLNTRFINNIFINIANKKFNLVKIFNSVSILDTDENLNSFLDNLKLLCRMFKLIDSGWVCLTNITAYIDTLSFKFNTLNNDDNKCSICLTVLNNIHFVKCTHCETYICVNCLHRYIKKEFKDCSESPRCYICRKDFLNLDNFIELPSIDPGVNTKKDVFFDLTTIYNFQLK